MNKKYMDFVPTGKQRKSAVGGTTKKVAVEKKTTVVAATAKNPIKTVEAQQKSKARVVREEIVTLEEDKLSIGSESFSLKKEPTYGVVEDYRPKFVKTEVEKRPLSQSHFVANKNTLTEAKSVKVASRKLGKLDKPVEKPVEKSEISDKKSEDKTKMKIPKSPFVNQAKVTKRPLSKNVYERKIKPTEEKPTGPVTIISKPDKDTKVGRVVAIILAIILGAAAGTVAFLLLPK